jgi:serine/threonine protein kinase
LPLPSAPSSKRIPDGPASEEKVAPRPPHPQGGAKALICPKCRARFDDAAPAPTHCPKDGIALVPAREQTESSGDTMLGRTLDGRFTILAKLGAGSMGTVYRARQHAMGRDVAVKILRSDRALDESAKGRFLREARANSLLASANTVTVFDFGQAASGELFLAMELLEGESLGARLTRVGRLSVPDSIDVCRQALRSIAEAHAKGIVHRDLKPDNLFFSKVAGGGKGEEVLKVLDFGIAKLVGDTNEVMNAVETQAGTVFGTPRYMSPEQAQGKPLDARSDLYSLGVILYHVLTGRPPFTDDDAVVVMARHIKTMPPPMAEACAEAGVPPEVEALVVRLLAKEPAMRPKTAEALAVELAHLVDSGIASTSGMRFSLSRSIPPPAILDGSTAPAPSAETLALAGLGGIDDARRRRSLKWGVTGLVAAAVVLLLILVLRTSDSPSASSPPASPVTPGAQTSPVSNAATDIPPPSDDPSPSAVMPTLSADQLPRVSSVPNRTAPPAETPKAGAWHRARPNPGAKGGSTGPGGNTAPAPSSAASSGYGYLE